MDDYALMEGVRRFDLASLAEAHDRYYPTIFRFVVFKVGYLETAEDLTSEVFFRLLEATRKCKGPKKNLLGWLYCVASHVIADYYRKKYRRPRQVVQTKAIPDHRVNLTEQIIGNQTLEEIHKAMEKLTDDQRKVVELRFVFELPINEVSRLMGKSEGAVKQLQARALAALTKTMTA